MPTRISCPPRQYVLHRKHELLFKRKNQFDIPSSEIVRDILFRKDPVELEALLRSYAGCGKLAKRQAFERIIMDRPEHEREKLRRQIDLMPPMSQAESSFLRTLNQLIFNAHTYQYLYLPPGILPIPVGVQPPYPSFNRLPS